MTTTDEADMLMLCATLERGKQLANAMPVLNMKPATQAVVAYLAPLQQAMAVWKKGLGYADCDKDLGDALRTTLVDAVVRAGNGVRSATDTLWGDKKWDVILKNLGAAIDVLTQAYTLAPQERLGLTLVALYSDRASCHMQIADVTSIGHAIKDFETATKISPQDAKIRSRLAGCYNARACKTSGSASVRDFTRAIELDNSKALYYRNRGVEHLNHDNHDAGIRDLRRALELEPDQETLQMLIRATNRR